MRILCTGGSGFVGRHFLRIAAQAGHELLNVDLRSPSDSSGGAVDSRQIDVRDGPAVGGVIAEFGPEVVVHLAAEATLEPATLAGYDHTTLGTLELVRALTREGGPSFRRLIHISTQHVYRRAEPPLADTDYDPDSLYAVSKVISEMVVRASDAPFEWTIVRPTNVWGPGNQGLADGLWRQLARGQYFHPRGDSAVKGYIYVANAVFQILRVAEAPRAAVDRRTLYASEHPMRQIDWIDAFAVAITGRPARRASRRLIGAAAWLGEGSLRLGIDAPIYLSRYRNLLSAQVVPTAEMYRICGEPPVRFADAVDETVDWLMSAGVVAERPR